MNLDIIQIILLLGAFHFFFLGYKSLGSKGDSHDSQDKHDNWCNSYGIGNNSVNYRYCNSYLDIVRELVYYDSKWPLAVEDWYPIMFHKHDSVSSILTPATKLVDAKVAFTHLVSTGKSRYTLVKVSVVG